jgi:alpha-L-arabinofuranosidase
MSRSRIGSTLPASRLVVAVLTGALATSLAAPVLTDSAEAAVRRHRHTTTIRVNASDTRGAVPLHQLGVNHRFVSNGHGVWDPELDRPEPLAVKRMRQAGVDGVRYPGGIVGNLFDWKDAIGPVEDRGCETHGQWTPQGYGAVRGNAYGVDEHMQLVEEIGGHAILMVPMITETPGDAADWVEYMNSPADGEGRKNPNGGIDWAEVRASNGRQQPYGVRWWEVGNEQRVNHQRYWMSDRMNVALRQYANGDTVHIQDEMLGRDCRQLKRGTPSNGTPGQVFQVLYPPFDSISVHVLDDGSATEWQQVTPEELAAAGSDDRVFTANEEEGEVTFGDGEHGAIPPKGAMVRASYRSVHKGAFAFIKAMREVDPKIKACVTWGLPGFIRVAGGRDYNCFSVHAYTHFKSERTNHWDTAVDGHDQNMLGTSKERAFVADIKRALPRGVSIALTEFGAIVGDSATYPEWTASMTRATYMASMWVNWLNLGIPLAAGSDLLAKSHRGLLGPAPDFTMSAEALTRQAIRPLYERGNRRIAVDVADNPVRYPRLRNAGGYAALSVAATKARNGELRVLVVNRLPSQRVRARVDLRHFASRRVAYLSRVNGASFRSWNTAQVHEVHLRANRRRIARDGFTEVFPAHSVTVIRVPARR